MTRFVPRRFTVLALSVLVIASGGLAARAEAESTVTSFDYTSDTGDYIGQGATDHFDPANADFTISGTAGRVNVWIDSGSEWWSVTLAAPRGTQLRPGAYDSARRAPFNGDDPGLDVDGNGRGCNKLTGSFVLYALAQAPDGSITNLDATFEQHCEGAEPALRGSIRYAAPLAAPVTLISVTPQSVASQPVTFTARVLTGTSGRVVFLVDGDGIASVPVDELGLASVTTAKIAAGTHEVVARRVAGGGPPATSAPLVQTVAKNTTSYRFDSSAGDYIGQGATASYAAPDASIVINGSSAYLTASVTRGNERWRVTLAAPEGEELAPGTYSDAQRAPFRDPGHPGLSVSGEGRGCNTLTGSFVIHAIVADPTGSVTRLDATFEQHCEGTDPALRGTIRYHAPMPSTTVLTTPSATVPTGSAVTVIVHVESLNGPGAGSVRFFQDGVPIGVAFLDATGTTEFTTLPLTPGTHQLRADYDGNDDAEPSSGSLTVTATT